MREKAVAQKNLAVAKDLRRAQAYYASRLISVRTKSDAEVIPRPGHCNPARGSLYYGYATVAFAARVRRQGHERPMG